MLRATFQEIIDQTRSEARLSTNTSRGVDHVEYIKQVIKRNYQMLAEDYDWEFLRLRRGSSGNAYKVMQANERYYNFPTNLNTQKIERAWYKWGTQWEFVRFQINTANYNSQDSDIGSTSDPVMAWDWYNAPDLSLQFEVWPMPASNGVDGGSGCIYFEGQRKVQALVNPTDRCDLDDILVSLRSAAEILRDNEKADKAAQKDALFAQRQWELRTSYGDRRRFSPGMQDPTSGPQGARPHKIEYVR